MSRQAIAYYVEGTTFTAAGSEFLHETMPVEIRTAASTRNSTADEPDEWFQKTSLLMLDKIPKVLKTVLPWPAVIALVQLQQKKILAIPVSLNYIVNPKCKIEVDTHDKTVIRSNRNIIIVMEKCIFYLSNF